MDTEEHLDQCTDKPPKTHENQNHGLPAIKIRLMYECECLQDVTACTVHTYV